LIPAKGRQYEARRLLREQMKGRRTLRELARTRDGVTAVDDKNKEFEALIAIVESKSNELDTKTRALEAMTAALDIRLRALEMRP